MPQTAKTPHRIGREGGDVFVSHTDFLDYLYTCAEAWAKKGETIQANLIRKQILRVKRQGEKNCAVCSRARMSFASTLSAVGANPALVRDVRKFEKK